MSYYIYCYQSQHGIPNIEEAQSVIEVFEERSFVGSNYNRKLEIAQALINCNPDFQKLDFNFDVSTTQEEIILKENNPSSVNIRLNTISTFGKVEVIIFDNNISFTVPYWYKDIHAEAVFEKLIVYTKIISRITGYYVYDPQAEIAYDPLKTCFSGLPLYLNLAKKQD